MLYLLNEMSKLYLIFLYSCIKFTGLSNCTLKNIPPCVLATRDVCTTTAR